MGVPSAAIHATNPILRTITLDVRIGGSPAREALNVTTSHGLSQVNATATVEGVERPGGAEETQSLVISAGINSSAGSGSDVIFTGEIDGIAWRDFPGSVPLSGRDKFARLRQPWGGDDREYTSQTSAAIIRNLAEAAGFDSSEMNIEEGDWGSLGAWTLGTAQPVVAKNGQPFWSLIERIDRLEGMRTFVNRSGNLLRRRISGNIGTGAIWEFEQGENIISCERSRKLDGIINHVVVTGLNYLGLQIGGAGIAEARASNPFLQFPFEYIADPIQDDLVEDNDRALFIAKRRVADRNRRPESYTLTVPYNPRVQPGFVVKITHDKLETQSGQRFMVDQVTHRIGLFGGRVTAQTTFTTLGGALVNAEINIPPVAAFSVQFFREAIDTGAGITPIVVLRADGSASEDPDGNVLTYAWTLDPDAGTATPDTGTEVIHTAVVEGATAIDITLTVTDADGATGTLGPQTFALNENTLFVEPLYLAVHDTLKASPDGEQTWNESAANGVTCTAPFAAPWGTIWGDEDGHVYITIDDLQTPAVDTGTPHGAVACTAVWLHELDTTRAWAAFADGAVYQGTVDSATPDITWALAGTVPAAPVRRIREAIGALGSLRVVADDQYLASEDGGGSWIALHTFAGDAREMLAGFEENWATAIGDAAPVFAETGTTPTVPGGVTDLPAATFGWQTQAAYVSDETGQLYTSDATFAALTAHADSAPVPVNHMIRSGNLDGVIYMAGIDPADSGALKWIPDVAVPWYIHRTDADACYMIGYGPARRPAVDIRFVFGTYNISGALDGFWEYNFGAWRHIAPPSGTSQWQWLQVVVHPTNPNRWLAFGCPVADFNTYGYNAFLFGSRVTTRTGGISPVWLTDDAGATWQEVFLYKNGNSGASSGTVGIYALNWQDNNGRFFVFGKSDWDGGTALWWEGTSATDALAHMPLVPLWLSPFWSQSGMGGDMVVAEQDSPGSGTAGRLARIPADGTVWTGETWLTDGVRGWNQPQGPFDVIKGQREFWQVSFASGAEGIAHWTDYRATDPASNAPPSVGPLTRPPDVSGNYQYVAVGDTHVYFASGVALSTGFYRRPHATWTPSGAPDYAANTALYVVTDRQSRRAAVGYADIGGSGDMAFAVHDGNAWQRIELPDPALKTANGGTGGIYRTARMVPIAAIGEVALL